MTEAVQPRWMSPKALMSFLENSGPSGLEALTHYVRPSMERRGIDGLTSKLMQHLDPETVHHIAWLIAKSETGAVLFWNGTSCRLILPPFPVSEDTQSPRWDPGPLQRILESEYLIGVLLLRLGRYAVGVYQGRTLLASKVATKFVHGRHRAGGSSQARFARRREKQAHELYYKACRELQERFTPFKETLDYIFLGGEKTTLESFQQRCPFLAKLSNRVLQRRLDVREPTQRALVQLPAELWGSWVYTVAISPLEGRTAFG